MFACFSVAVFLLLSFEDCLHILSGSSDSALQTTLPGFTLFYSLSVFFRGNVFDFDKLRVSLPCYLLLVVSFFSILTFYFLPLWPIMGFWRPFSVFSLFASFVLISTLAFSILILLFYFCSPKHSVFVTVLFLEGDTMTKANYKRKYLIGGLFSVSEV